MATAREQLEVLIKSVGMDQVQAEIRNLGDQAKKTGTETITMGDKFSQVGAKTSAFGAAVKAAFTGAAGLAILKFGKDSVAAFKEAEESQIKLEDAFSRFPALANTNIDALRALNEEIMRKTGIDDDQLAAAQANLAAFGLTGQQIQALTPMVADYATKTGQDVTAAADALGKAVLGQGRALKAVGVDFVNTGTKSGNLQQIFDKLGPSVSGLAEKMGDTAAGKAKRLQQQFEELKEQVGSKLLPVINTITGAVLSLVEGFTSLPGPVQAAIGIALGLGSALLALNKIIGLVKNAQMALTVVMNANPFVLIATLVLALGAALIYAYKHSETFRKIVNDAFRAIAPTVGTVIGYVVGALSSLVKAFSGAISGVLEVVSHIPKIGDAAKTAQAAVNGAAKGITDKLDSIAVGAKGMTVNFANSLSDKLPKATKKGTESAGDVAKKFATDLTKTGEIAGDNLGKGIKKKSGAVKKAVKDVVDEAKKQLAQFTNDVQDILASTSAKRALAKAEKELNDLYAEQAGLGDAIAQAQLRINRARQEGAIITAEEQVAIEDAQAALDDANAAVAEYAALPAQIAEAQARLAQVQGDSEASTSDLKDAEKDLADLRKRYAEGAPYSPAKLKVLEDKLSQAKADAIAPTDDLKDAESELAELRKREVEIQNDIADANQTVTDKTFALIEAQQKADAAQADLVKNGKNLIDYFTKLGLEAGLSADQINRVTSAILAQSGISGGGGGAKSPATTPLDAAKLANDTIVTGTKLAVATNDKKLATSMINSLDQILLSLNSQMATFSSGLTVNNNITVEGSVVTEQQLADMLREQYLMDQYYGKSLFLP